MDDFGSLLREKRQKKGLTQEALSKQLADRGQYVDATVISRWETGKRSPGVADRGAVLALGSVLDMREDEMNQFLIRAGLASLQAGDLDLDKVLESLGPHRWRKTSFLQKRGWEEGQIGEKLGITFWEVREDLNKAKEEEAETVEFSGADVEVTIEPGRAKYFDIGLTANAIQIDWITVRPSDPGVPFQFIIFDRAQQADYPVDEDVVCEESSRGRRIAYRPVRPAPYEDRDGSKQLHCGIALDERPLRFDMGEKELQTYLQRPVSFKVTLRYRAGF